MCVREHSASRAVSRKAWDARLGGAVARRSAKPSAKFAPQTRTIGRGMCISATDAKETLRAERYNQRTSRLFPAFLLLSQSRGQYPRSDQPNSPARQIKFQSVFALPAGLSGWLPLPQSLPPVLSAAALRDSKNSGSQSGHSCPVFPPCHQIRRLRMLGSLIRH